ncbi:hypothetical protein VTK56DRAFT_6134 [Thermocarpiscus australiensis]
MMEYIPQSNLGSCPPDSSEPAGHVLNKRSWGCFSEVVAGRLEHRRQFYVILVFLRPQTPIWTHSSHSP